MNKESPYRTELLQGLGREASQENQVEDPHKFDLYAKKCKLQARVQIKAEDSELYPFKEQD